MKNPLRREWTFLSSYRHEKLLDIGHILLECLVCAHQVIHRRARMKYSRMILPPISAPIVESEQLI